VRCSVLHCVALCCTVLHCVALCCTVLQHRIYLVFLREQLLHRIRHVQLLQTRQNMSKISSSVILHSKFSNAQNFFLQHIRPTKFEGAKILKNELYCDVAFSIALTFENFLPSEAPPHAAERRAVFF